MLDLLKHRMANPGALPYDEEAPVARELETLGYVDLRKVASSIEDDYGVRLRAHIRYIAALLPHLDKRVLAEALHSIINNRAITLSDMRLIIDGRALYDPSRRTNEVPIERIQTVGRVLMNGGTKAAAAVAAGVNPDTVDAIDNFLGMTRAYDDKILSSAIDALREGWSVRRFADSLGLSKSTAHRVYVRARGVLAELGEVTQ